MAVFLKHKAGEREGDASDDTEKLWPGPALKNRRLCEEEVLCFH
jgi:hypothetical protein